MKREIGVIGIILLLGVFLATASKALQEDWTVPAKYKKMKNPHVNTQDTEKIGKTLWIQHCKSCHGSKGLGDGKKAGTLEKDLSDFSSSDFKSQTDGAIYYKTLIGRDEMPNFEKKIPLIEDRWLLINYLRTFK